MAGLGKPEHPAGTDFLYPGFVYCMIASVVLANAGGQAGILTSSVRVELFLQLLMATTDIFPKIATLTTYKTRIPRCALAGYYDSPFGMDQATDWALAGIPVML